MAALEPGTLRVTLQFAKGIKNCETWGRQDPYVKLRVGDVEKRSRTCARGGQAPVWDETFEFNLFDENSLQLTLLDHDRGLHDDLIGTVSVALSRAREQGHDTVQAPLSNGKKQQEQQGFIQVQLSFEPRAKPQQTAAQPAAAAVHQRPAGAAAAPVTMAGPPPQTTAYGGYYPPAPMMAPMGHQMPHPHPGVGAAVPMMVHQQPGGCGGAVPGPVPMVPMPPTAAAPAGPSGAAWSGGSFMYMRPQQPYAYPQHQQPYAYPHQQQPYA